jgi:translation initiation factor 2 beta subunit (eIF-2beta)/eIF-5
LHEVTVFDVMELAKACESDSEDSTTCEDTDADSKGEVGFASGQTQIRKHDKLRVHAGSACVTATVIHAQLSKRILKLKLQQPLCAPIASMIAIEKLFGSSWHLCAHARVTSGKECFFEGSWMNTDREPITVSAEVRQTGSCLQLEGFNWVDRFLEACGPQRKCSKRRLPDRELVPEGGAHAIWVNFGAIMHILDREPNLFVAFWKSDAGIDSSIAGDQKEKLRISWRGFGRLARRLDHALQTFIRTYVECHQCGGRSTSLQQSKVLCRDCSASRFVTR